MGRLRKFATSKIKTSIETTKKIAINTRDVTVETITKKEPPGRNTVGNNSYLYSTVDIICHNESVEISLRDHIEIIRKAGLLSQNCPGTENSPPRPINLGNFKFDTDGFTYPSLFEEADDMIKLSCLVYTLVELRKLGRSGKLDENPNSLRILKLPLSFDTAFSILAAEAKILKENLKDGKHDAALSAVHSLLNRRSVSASSGGNDKCGKNSLPDASKLSHPGDKSSSCFEPEDEIPMLVAVGDTNVTKELVYAIGINPLQKRITVAFRGSVTKVDFFTDAKINLVKVPHPSEFFEDRGNSFKEGSPNDDSKDQIRIHQGFYEYLFGEDDKNNNKFTEIIDQVRSLFDADPNRRKEYKLYVTGHSLGGALATLFGFYATASSLPFPVTVVSVASPRVGNAEFARAFLELESHGKLRHLRIVNHMDPVTLGPITCPKRTLAVTTKTFSPAGLLIMKAANTKVGDIEKYYHTGIKLTLFKESKYCISYSGASFMIKSLNHQLDNGNKKDNLEEVCNDIEAEDDFEEEYGDEGDGDGDDEKESNKDVEEVPHRKRLSKPKLPILNIENMPLVAHHHGTAYCERFLMVGNELSQMTLNGIYLDKSSTQNIG